VSPELIAAFVRLNRSGLAAWHWCAALAVPAPWTWLSGPLATGV
jgi:hypothetical protein